MKVFDFGSNIGKIKVVTSEKLPSDCAVFGNVTLTNVGKVVDMGITDSEIETRFTYHKPKGDQPERYEKLREAAKSFARLVADSCPDSREASLAMTHIEEAVMWANAAIARRDSL